MLRYNKYMNNCAYIYTCLYYTYILIYIELHVILLYILYIYIYIRIDIFLYFLYVYITYYTQKSPGSESLYPIYGCVIFEFPRCDQRREHSSFGFNLFWESLLEDQPELRFV